MAELTREDLARLRDRAHADELGHACIELDLFDALIALAERGLDLEEGGSPRFAAYEGAWADGLRRFVLDRHEDETGVSSALAGKPAVGIVAWGVAFPDGFCVTRWCVSDIRQTCVWSSLDDLIAVHGHGGKTDLVWLDGPADEKQEGD